MRAATYSSTAASISGRSKTAHNISTA
ncbi:hypothetical protein STIAU_0648, partial [Stigmatella aurantiaca DW4/3-1]